MFTEFAQHVIKNGLSSSNRYKVEIPLPIQLQGEIQSLSLGGTENEQQDTRIQPQLTGTPGELNRQLQLMCITAPFPGGNIDTHPSNISGQKRNMPYAETHDVYDLLFYCSSKMTEKLIFDYWRMIVLNPFTKTLGFYNNYITDITIHQLDDQNNIMYSNVMLESYPTVVTPIILDKTADKQINQLNVSFTYAKSVPLSMYNANNRR